MSEITSMPMVSIGMPVFNGEKYIRQALDSLITQTHTNLEIIISDNASTDATEFICNEYAAKDDRVKLHRSERNNGANWNFNRVFELSSGTYFMWAAHDDCWDHRYIEVCLKAFNRTEGIVLSGTACRIVKQNSNEFVALDKGLTTIDQKLVQRFMNYKKMLQGVPNTNSISYGIYKRALLNKIMPMKKVIGADHILLASLSLLGEFSTAKEILLTKRIGGASGSHKKNAKALSLDKLIFIKFPYLVREYYLQRLIHKTNKLIFMDKIRLSLWSVINYLLFNFLRGLYFSLKRTLLRPVKVVLKRS